MLSGGRGKKGNFYEQKLDYALFNKFKTLYEELKTESNLSQEQILDLIENQEMFLPINIFNNRRLGILEIIVKFLHEEKKIPFNIIANMLNRDNRTIWSSYDQSKKKNPEKTVVTFPNADNEIIIEYPIPIKIFSNRSYGVLEILVSYLKDHFQLKFSQISLLLARDQRTIWTVYNRAKKKGLKITID